MAAEERASHLEQVAEDARRALERLSFKWAMVGGLAVSARSEPRFTRDVDLAVAVADDREAEALIRELQPMGYGILVVLEQEISGRLATVRFQPPGSEQHGVILDLLFASSGIEPEIVRTASLIEVFPDMELPVAGVGELLALKVLARDDERRPQDAIDIRALLRGATEADYAVARRSLEIIMERGYHRNRDLLAEFEKARQEQGPRDDVRGLASRAL
jgi:predicted nucleotidyltransferase